MFFHLVTRENSNKSSANIALEILLGKTSKLEKEFFGKDNKMNKPVDLKAGKIILGREILKQTKQLADYYDLLIVVEPNSSDAIAFMNYYIESKNPLFSDIRKQEYSKFLKELNK